MSLRLGWRVCCRDVQLRACDRNRGGDREGTKEQVWRAYRREGLLLCCREGRLRACYLDGGGDAGDRSWGGVLV